MNYTQLKQRTTETRIPTPPGDPQEDKFLPKEKQDKFVNAVRDSLYERYINLATLNWNI